MNLKGKDGRGVCEMENKNKHDADLDNMTLVAFFVFVSLF